MTDIKYVCFTLYWISLLYVHFIHIKYYTLLYVIDLQVGRSENVLLSSAVIVNVASN